jgi:GNAT superfamily N-acetyltransferase
VIRDSLHIRPMTPVDVAEASALATAQGWRDRTRHFEFTMRVPTCIPLVGTVDGRIVATALGTANGPVGWIGAIVVDAAYRRIGYGRAITEETIERLRRAGCHSISLAATKQGRPLYERLGFHVLCWYVEMDPTGPLTAPTPPAGSRIRRIEAADLPAVFALDRAATGEDRHMVLGALADDGGWLLEDDAGIVEGDEWAGPAPSLRGFLLPSDRGHGAIVAPRFEDGLCLMNLHALTGRDGPGPRCGMPDAHGDELDAIAARGWTEHDRMPRMILGDDPSWRPRWIWGQVNSAIG